MSERLWSSFKLMKSGKFVVKHHTPGQRWAMIIGGLVFMVVAGWGLYIWGAEHAGFDRLQASEKKRSLLDTIQHQKRTETELRDKVALLERSAQVDKKAHVDVNDSLKGLQQEILELRGEVSFYRGIVAAKESSAGLRIENLRLAKVAGEGLYHYKLVLTQVLKNHKTVRGRVNVKIEGLLNGKAKKVSLASVSVVGKKKLDFKFRYFQKFEGDIRLGPGFVPRSVHVQVKPRKRKEIISTFDWDDLLGNPGDEKLSEETALVP